MLVEYPRRSGSIRTVTAVEPLRIAVIAPLAWRTPPRAYGPWELFASYLTEGLVERGHDVTLFATGDSITAANLSSVTARGWEVDTDVEPKVVECLHIAAVFERAAEFDIIHNSFDFLPLTYSRLVAAPVVTTIHGFSSEHVVDAYAAYNDVANYVAISDANRHSRLDYAATVGHGVATPALLSPGSGDHLLFFGRVHPDKGTAEAIKIARSCSRRLDIAGIIQDRSYFDDHVAPHIDGETVRYLGPVPADERDTTLAEAFALLHPIAFAEPFGFSVAEALSVGTPVVAFDRGSMSELIDHGTTGFVVDDVDAAVVAVERCVDLDRVAIARRAQQRFSIVAMVDQYVAVYRSVLGSKVETCN